MRLRFSAIYDRIIFYHLLFQLKNGCDGSSGKEARAPRISRIEIRTSWLRNRMDSIPIYSIFGMYYNH